MPEFLKDWLKQQPYWSLALLLGTALVAAPFVTVTKDFYFSTQTPTSYLLVTIGVSLILLSIASFSISMVTSRAPTSGGLDLSSVEEREGVFSTRVSGCEIRVWGGRLEDCELSATGAIVLPVNEYFDDICAHDAKSALGGFVTKVFPGQATEFIELMTAECRARLGEPKPQQKTADASCPSFGPGRCLLIMKPLGRPIPTALVSTTTQRAGQGHSARISYLFDAIRDLVSQLADARINEAVMPVLGSGHGGLAQPLAFVGMLLAIAEAARYGQGAQRLKRVGIVVFKPEKNGAWKVDPVTVKRGLALVGSSG